jgi:hypothetical protein
MCNIILGEYGNGISSNYGWRNALKKTRVRTHKRTILPLLK